jgi:hypothetical protein
MIAREILGCTEGDAARWLDEAGGEVKIAILLGLGVGRSEAANLLRRHAGNLRSAIDAFTQRARAPSPGTRQEGRGEGAQPQTPRSLRHHD